MKYIELFAGIGGFRYGIENVTATDGQQSGLSERGDSSTHLESEQLAEQQFSCHGAKPHIQGARTTWRRHGLHHKSRLIGDKKYHCVYANEWDRYASSIYRRHYGEIDTRDIRDVPSTEIPDHELLTGGFPCQSFSIAGKRGGFNDTRGTLFFEIARILRDKRPQHFLLENVKGLLSHEQGQTFQTILGVLSDIGYRTEWMVLNSKHFGVPQNRERVFIVGHLRGGCRGKVFPVIGTGGRTLEELTIDTAEAERIYNPDGVSRTIKDGGGGGAKTGLYAITRYSQGYKFYSTSGISTTLTSRGGGLGANTGLYAISRKGIGNKLDVAKTLNKSDWRGLNRNQEQNAVIENMRIRRLTPIECERLQGFPDNWTKHGIDENGTEILVSDTQRYKACGNAVTTNVITAIMRNLTQEESKQ